jgi:hypothetical protein
MLEPLVGLVIFSFSYTMGPVALISSIPLVLDVSVIGTALGVYKCASNIGSALVDPVIGVVQDHYGRLIFYHYFILFYFILFIYFIFFII